MNRPFTQPKKPRAIAMQQPRATVYTGEDERVTVVIYLPAPTPSLNAFTYRHWRVQDSAKKTWGFLLKAALGASPRGCTATGKRSVLVQRFGKQPLDYDNLVGGLKRCVIDNLRNLHLLVDDTDEFMELRAENAKRAKGDEPHTIITLKDL